MKILLLLVESFDALHKSSFPLNFLDTLYSFDQNFKLSKTKRKNLFINFDFKIFLIQNLFKLNQKFNSNISQNCFLKVSSFISDVSQSKLWTLNGKPSKKKVFFKYLLRSNLFVWKSWIRNFKWKFKLALRIFLMYKHYWFS